MAAKARDWGLFFTFSGLFAVFIFFDVELVIWYSIRAVAALAVFTLLYHMMAPLIKKLSTWWYDSQTPTHTGSGLNEAQLEERRAQARRRIQQQHQAKADSYTERILRPRQDARAQRQEVEYRRSTGHSIPWSSPGQQLANNAPLTGNHGNAETAALSRRLPGNIDKQENLPTTTHKKSTKKKLSLPEEPPEGGEGVITVILRTPQGRSFRRRVLVTDTIQLLLDYMTSIGYHQKLYSLSLTYPRRVISSDPVARLLDINIDRDTALNIEEKEEETPEGDDI